MNESGTQPLYRFAPSPNGLLHLGHAYSALLNFHRAKHDGGRFLLRIDDIDPLRSLTHYEDAIYEDLKWLGLEWETPVLRQSEHLPLYADAVTRLDEAGWLYPCFCSRAEITRDAKGAQDPDGSPLYPGTCRHLSEDERQARIGKGDRHVMRLKSEALEAIILNDLSFDEYHEGEVPSRILASLDPWGDAVIARKDVKTSYHLSVVMDDARQGITDVIRGADLFASTSIHRILQKLLDLPTPRYRHHHLIMDDEGEKLAKSHGSRALRDLRDEGVTAEEIKKLLGFA
ncbi:MAG: tRNA glutamyl-Q(34) synthetase GluQRS [Alphaproteobacteria bacterium]|nr:tRNA glutamyl-Q(34) synthetase GluQRS [Alphaproteobacteria bacterium]